MDHVEAVEPVEKARSGPTPPSYTRASRLGANVETGRWPNARARPATVPMTKMPDTSSGGIERASDGVIRVPETRAIAIAVSWIAVTGPITIAISRIPITITIGWVVITIAVSRVAVAITVGRSGDCA